MTHLGIFHLVLYNPPPPGSPASNFDIPAGIPVTFTIPSRTRNFHQYPKKKELEDCFLKKSNISTRRSSQNLDLYLIFIYLQTVERANINSENAITSPASTNGTLNTADMLDSHGNTPLHVCVMADNLLFFALFARNDDAHLTSPNEDGNTVLHLIAIHNRSRFLQYLDLSHLNTNVLNNKGQTPWNIALQRENSDVAMFLLQNRWNLSMDIL